MTAGALSLKNFHEIEVGLELPPVQKKVTQKTIDTYAQASGDFNPLHIDPEFASKTMFKGTIAHGLLSLGYISEMMANFFADGWYSGSNMEVSFLAPVRPGDTVTATGKVKSKEVKDNKGIVTCEVACINEEGVKVIAGTAKATVNL